MSRTADLVRLNMEKAPIGCLKAGKKVKTNPISVADYIASQPKAAQKSLEQVRRAIRKAVPQAEETISYKIPAYKLRGERMLFFAGWKRHYSLYPATKRLLQVFRAELKPFAIHKSTIRFSLSEPVPAKLIARIAKFRGKEISARKSPAKRDSRRDKGRVTSKSVPRSIA